jgi:hypothetical protein
LEQVILQQIARAEQLPSRKLAKGEFSTIITSLTKPRTIRFW